MRWGFKINYDIAVLSLFQGRVNIKFFCQDTFRTFIMCLALLCAGCSRDSRPADTDNHYSGSANCRQCHEEFYALWSTSHHGLAMQPVTSTFIQQSLTPQETPIEIGKEQFSIDLAKQQVLEKGSGRRKSHKMVHAMGGKNVYYFLTSAEKGRLQVLPLAYDVRNKTWFNATASMVRHFGDINDAPLDWKDSMLTFNTACFSCHVSQLSKNYDIKTDTYETVWKEPGINCETCHGPGHEHSRIYIEAEKNHTKPGDLKLISMKTMTNQQRDTTCAPCHAKMRPITTSFKPGEKFFDHYDLVTLENQDFYPDGRDLGENYTYTLWLTSPCVKAGKLECIHCHTSSGRYRFSGDKTNSSCLPCHKERVTNAVAHTHHKPDSKGSICISCHMPMTAFARMQRSDHSMLPPTPSATMAFNSPNACNICHQDKDAKWSDDYVRKWHKHNYQEPVLYRAGLVDSARKRNWNRLDDTLKFISNLNNDSIFVTSLIRLLQTCDTPDKWPVLLQALKHPSPLVRSAAAVSLDDDPDRRTVNSLVETTGDECRLVRISAASSLARYADIVLKMPSRETSEAAFRELESSYMSMPDSWSSHYNIGNYYDQRGQTSQALKSYEQAMRLRSDTILPIVNASMIHARQGRMDTAIQMLRNAFSIDPKNAAVNFNLGLALAEQNKTTEAEHHLRTALISDPAMTQAAYNLGILLNRNGVTEEGIKWCRKAVELRPGNSDYVNALNFYLRAQKQKSGSDDISN